MLLDGRKGNWRGSSLFYVPEKTSRVKTKSAERRLAGVTVRNVSGDFASSFAQQEKIFKGPTLGNAVDK
jgi:hypothetical protein